MEKENNYRFEIIPKNWAMRRKPAKEPEPVSVTIPDFKYVKNHSCTMHVTYDNDETKTYLSRVLQNHITQEWKVDGMHVAVKVVPC
ncbi:hypothetical protein EYS14_10835 [Alteromonadaceae bacterium M269]|nr:hypothetical protein EYS14_10835 [Alteromonadaceae bacterium M269]